ncbi:DMT family transporter [bacterium]|nr:DMT family transporter [bacterium]
MKNAKDNKAYFLLMTVIILWGMNYIVGRILSSDYLFGYIHVSGILYGFFRYFVGALTMMGVMVYQRKSIRSMRNEVSPYYKVLMLSAGISAVFVLNAHMSHKYVSGGTTSIIINLCPLLVFLYSIVVFKEKSFPIKVAGFLLGTLGGMMYLYFSIQELEKVNHLGILLSLVAMVAWAGYTITLHYMEGGNRTIIISVQHSASTLIILPFLFFYLRENPVIFVGDMVSFGGVFFGGVLASGVAYLLYFRAIEMLGASRAASFLFLVPFVSLGGDMVLGEIPGLMTLLAGVVAIIGVAFIKMAGSFQRK